MPELWILIPTFDGPHDVPRLILRQLAGQTLLARAITTAVSSTAPERVIVVTHDDEVEEVALHHGVHVLPAQLDTSTGTTAAEVLSRHAASLTALGADDDDVLLMLKPNWPLISAAIIHQARDAVASGAGSAITVTADTGATWTIDGEANASRRQDESLRERDAISACRVRDAGRWSEGAVHPVSLITLRPHEAVSIDSFADLPVATYWLNRKSVIIRTDAGRQLGMGHVYRSLSLAHELAEHDELIVTSRDQPLGGAFFDRHPFPHTTVSSDEEFIELVRSRRPDLVVLDVLDTDESFITGLAAASPESKIVSFEDHGSGAPLVDVLVCDIYENPAVALERQMVGVVNALLAPSFESVPRRARAAAEVDEILVLFGGTDPSGLAVKALDALEAVAFAGHVTVVRGLGAEPLDVSGLQLDITVKTDVTNMARLMSEADLALSSAGRTLAELSSLGVPTICMAQNSKELRHTHSTVDHGVVLLGLGTEVDQEELRATIARLIADIPARARLQQAALDATRGRTNARVVSEILRRAGLLTETAPTGSAH